MKKVLTITALFSVILLTAVATLTGDATAGQKKKTVTNMAVITECVQGDTGCVDIEKEVLLDAGHDLTPDQQKVIDDAWSDNSNLTPEELAIKKKYGIK